MSNLITECGTATLNPDVDTVPRGTNPAAAILHDMAAGNAEQAARLLRINATGMARWHLNEAMRQLEQAEALTKLSVEPTIIELNATTTEPNGKPN